MKSQSLMPTFTPKKPAKVEIYKDAAKEWRWRLLAPNGKIIADSGEGYSGSQGARLAWNRLRAYVYFEVRHGMAFDAMKHNVIPVEVVKEKHGGLVRMFKND